MCACGHGSRQPDKQHARSSTTVLPVFSCAPAPRPTINLMGGACATAAHSSSNRVGDAQPYTAAASAAAAALACVRSQVSLEEGDSKARELSVNFIETSAKAGFNIKVGRSGEWGWLQTRAQARMQTVAPWAVRAQLTARLLC